jgi:cytochrome c oxidase subunit IV
MSAHFLNVIWVALMVATLLTWFIGKAGQMGSTAVIAILLIAAVKGWLIVYDFMALRRVKFLWRALVLGWLLLTLTIILLAYWLGIK